MTRGQAWLEDVWYRDAVGAVLLAPLSALFALATGLRRQLYRLGVFPRTRVSVPVVVIGNLTVGGTGKTPLVAELAAGLRRRGLKVGILLRGYGASIGAPQQVTRGSLASEVGDEACMLAADSAALVVVSPERVAGARWLEQQGVELILCDDGLQHYALHRDLEIVVIDGRRGLGNGRLLPAGPLRESVQRLASVDYVVVNVTALDGALEPRPWARALPQEKLLTLELLPEAARRLDQPTEWRSLSQWCGQTVHAVAGIGHPERFFAMLRAAGLVLREHAFKDHHAFTAADFDFGDGYPVLMTSKDAVKCRAFADGRLWELPVATRLGPDGGAAILARLASLGRKESR